jgi:hypothetical protein
MEETTMRSALLLLALMLAGCAGPPAQPHPHLRIPPAPAAGTEARREHDYCEDLAFQIYLDTSSLSERLADGALGGSRRMRRHYDGCMGNFRRANRYYGN